MACVTSKFVCFDGIEGKKLADEVVRERERERERERYVCGGEKKRGKKEGNTDEK